MSNDDLKQLLSGGEYAFLRENDRLGDRIMLLGLSGSRSYGTATEDSDVDLRGVTLQSPEDLLGLAKFEQYEDVSTDTVVYGFNKYVKLMLECNPICCELLGLPDDKYIVISETGREMLANRAIFLSKRAVKSFGGYATAQLRRLQNATACGELPQSERERQMLNSMQTALEAANDAQQRTGGYDMRLYIDEAASPDMDMEIFIDAQLNHVPLREHLGALETLRGALDSWNKAKRREAPLSAKLINKHAMHTIRLLATGTDLLARGEIITYRQQELQLLRRIRAGEYMQPNGALSPEFYAIVEEYQQRFKEAAARTALPDSPDMARVSEFVQRINRIAIGR